MAVTYNKLEAAFARILSRNRTDKVLERCPEEAFTAHAFFDLEEDSGVTDPSIVPATIPFESLWIVTHYKGLALAAYVEKMSDAIGLQVRPDYLFYMEAVGKFRCDESEIEEVTAFIVDRCLKRLTANHLKEVDSDINKRVNKARAAKGRPALPSFIRITNEVAITEPKGGTHSSPTGHDRRGHWRTYKMSGKTVWINPCKVNGGATAPQTYHSETQGAA